QQQQQQQQQPPQSQASASSAPSASSTTGAASSAGSSAGAGERRSVPLRLSYLCRGLSLPDPGRCCLELHSPCCKRSCLLRCPTPERANVWFAALHAQIDLLTAACLAELNRVLPASQEVKQMGWLAEQVHDDSGHPGWRPAFCAISDRDILLYEAAPASREAWSSPMHQHPLLATRLVPTARQATYWLFGTRTGGRLGTEADLAAWSRTLVDAAHSAVESAQEVAVACRYAGHDCRLVLHADCGFSMREAASGRQLWCLPYESLRRSADDGQRLAWLDFGEQGQFELDLLGCPKPFVFILHTILSSKLHRHDVQLQASLFARGEADSASAAAPEAVLVEFHSLEMVGGDRCCSCCCCCCCWMACCFRSLQATLLSFNDLDSQHPVFAHEGDVVRWNVQLSELNRHTSVGPDGTSQVVDIDRVDRRPGSSISPFCQFFEKAIGQKKTEKKGRCLLNITSHPSSELQLSVRLSNRTQKKLGSLRLKVQP
uniref:PH_17 domain-containing protein n=1 Tax=Macrostomum lignano TaxID=282301 RepID=A0A1I8IRM1_9PLAT